MAELISGVELDSADMSKREMDRFNAFWDSEAYLNHLEGMVRWWPEEHKIWALRSVEMYKAHHDNAEFRGVNPTKGYGVRGIMPADIFGAQVGNALAGAAHQDWDVDTTFQLAVTGRAWIGGTGPDGATFTADTFAQTYGRVNNNEHWYVFIMGVVDRAQSPRVSAFILNIDSEQQALIESETAFALNEMQVKWFVNPILLTNLRPLKLGVYVPVAATARLLPIGFTILDSNRAKVRDFTLMDVPTAIA